MMTPSVKTASPEVTGGGSMVEEGWADEVSMVEEEREVVVEEVTAVTAVSMSV